MVGGEAMDDACPPAPFVVGVGRSGTTLLRLMLDAHPDLAIPPETHFIRKLVRIYERGTPSSSEALDVIAGSRRWRDFGLSRDDLRVRLEQIDMLTAGEALRTFYATYAERFGKSRWGDKSTIYLTRMAKIERVLPEARFVHLIRDGRDVALSLVKTHLRGRSLEKAAGNWASRVMFARRQGREIRHYLEVRYEALVRNPEAVLRRVCDFVELPWNAKMLEYHLDARQRLAEMARELPSRRTGREPIAPQQRIAAHIKTLGPPDERHIGRWRTDVTAEQITGMEAVAGRALAKLGYSLHGPCSNRD
jgi:sulfotransferase family protein